MPAATKAKSFLNEETHFQGKYAKQVFEALYFAYQPFFGRIILLLCLGFLGRVLLLANANMIGVWVDSFCRAPAQCKPVPSYFQGFGNQDFLWLLALMTLAGFVCTSFFRIGFSRLSSQAVSRLYDETT